jgi:hypothetical protein
MGEQNLPEKFDPAPLHQQQVAQVQNPRGTLAQYLEFHSPGKS